MIEIDPGDFSPESIAKLAPKCAECPGGVPVVMVRGSVIYPRRPDLADNWFWRCECGAYCGIHKGTLKALGRPAGLETRRARNAAHAAFDPLWEKRQRLSGLSKSKARGRGYKWLARELGIAAKDCHIAEMDAAMALRVVEICKAARS